MDHMRLPIPVPTNDFNRRVRPPMLPPSLRERFLAWVRYYSIQSRWYLERRLARMLHRRWGDQF